MLDSPEIDVAALRSAFGCFPTGITVVATRDHDGRPTGVTVSSFSSLSMTPPLCVFSLARSQVSCRWIEAHATFVVNVLSGDQEHVAMQFAKPLDDKFDGIDWTEGENGMPLITGSVAQFECRTWATYDGGDHLIVVGEITSLHNKETTPLLYCRSKIGRVPQ